MEEKVSHNQPKLMAPPLLGSARLAITLMCLVGSFNALFMTINLGMVIVCMNKSGHNNNTVDSSDSNCTIDSNEVTPSTFCDSNSPSDVTWDKSSQGLLLSATYYGVVSMQLLVGWLCDKFGKVKLLMIGGNLILGITSVLSPVIILYAGVPAFFVTRIIKGAGMAIAISPVLPLLNKWSTPNEQGLLVSLALAGVGIANAATYPLTGLMCTYSGWKSIFYYCGGSGLIWSFVALFMVYDSPKTHPRVSVEEKQYLLAAEEKTLSGKKKVVIPWKNILLSIPVWSVIVTNFFFFAATKGTAINLPLYIRDVLDFSVTENGIFSAMPAVAALIVHLIVGPLFDYVRAKKVFSVTVIRKIFHVIGTLFPAATMFAVSQVPSDQKYVIIALITVGYSLYEVAWMGGFCFSMLDMAPDYVGILQGMNNTIGLMPGFIMPVVIAQLTPNGTSQEWSYVFLMFGGLYSLACLIYLLTGSAELQSWGKAKSDSNQNQIVKSHEKIVI